MRFLITGGSGFIGRNLTERLGGSHEVLAPSHAELDLCDAGAIRDYLRANPVDTIIHSATRPGHRNAPDPTGLLDANTRMFFNLVRNQDTFGKMILLTTGAVYDMRHYTPKMAEDRFDAHVPVDETGFSKYICAKYAARFDNIVELRPFGVFGKYEDYAIRFISNAICKTLFDLPITIRQNRRFDYIHVDDLARVIEHFATEPAAHGAYNVTPDDAVELYRLAEKVREVSGKDLPIVVAQPGMGTEYSGDNRRLRGEFTGWTPARIDDDIARLYDWYLENRGSIDRELLLVDK